MSTTATVNKIARNGGHGFLVTVSIGGGVFSIDEIVISAEVATFEAAQRDAIKKIHQFAMELAQSTTSPI